MLTTLWRLSPSIFSYTKPSTNPGGVLRKAALFRTASRNATLDSSGTMKLRVHLDFGGSRTTMRNVAIGPKKIDAIHQLEPLLPFVCARPAFMRESVNQPTAYSPVSRITINSHSNRCGAGFPLVLGSTRTRTKLLHLGPHSCGWHREVSLEA